MSEQSAEKRQKVAVEETRLEGFDGEKTEYLKYTEISTDYDVTRAPNGMGIILGELLRKHNDVSQLKLLDVGCGTGTFLAAVKGKIQAEGIEYNDGMLAQAKARGLDVMQGNARALAKPDAAFDAVTMNQVIHHFPEENGYEFLGAAVKEAFRVLKPGGMLAVNTSSPEQGGIDGFWWLALFPQATEVMTRRFPPLDKLTQKMEEAGFTTVTPESTVIFPNLTLMDNKMYSQRGVEAGFDPKYRAGDSSWGLAESLGELEGGLARLKEMQADGSAQAWFQEREARRLKIGQVTIVLAMKPL